LTSLPRPNPPAAVIAEARCSSAIPITESELLSAPVPSHPDSDSRTDFNIWAINNDSNCPAAADVFLSFTAPESSGINLIPAIPALIV
jgi:hypothetical protein